MSWKNGGKATLKSAWRNAAKIYGSPARMARTDLLRDGGYLRNAGCATTRNCTANHWQLWSMTAPFLVHVFAQSLAILRIDQAHLPGIPLHLHSSADPSGRCVAISCLNCIPSPSPATGKATRSTSAFGRRSALLRHRREGRAGQSRAGGRRVPAADIVLVFAFRPQFLGRPVWNSGFC